MKYLKRFGSIAVLAGTALASLFISASAVQAAIPTQAGIWCSQEPGKAIPSAKQQALLGSLRRITGFCELNFTESGRLIAGDASSVHGGSVAAREILLDVLRSGMVYLIEDHSGSASVNFGQLDGGLNYENEMTSTRRTIWRVRIDFKDFREMEAPPEVRASFDEGFTLLHELLHGLGFKDATHPAEIGECEELLNRARAELNLPLRDQYFGQPQQLAPGIITVRLRFKSLTPSAARSSRREQYLFFLPGRETLIDQRGALALETDAEVRRKKR